MASPTATAADPELLGWPPDGPTLRLDHRRFSYAGKFVMSNSGKAVIRAAGGTAAGGRDGDAAGGRDGDVAGSPDGDAAGDAEDADWDDRILAAAAFNADRTDADRLWIRYVTVRDDRRGEGLGPELCAFVAHEAAGRGYERVRIAVNNPYAYEACYRAGFAYTGEETGLAELVLERPADEAAARRADRSASRYRAGLAVYRERDLTPAETAFLERKREEGLPEMLP